MARVRPEITVEVSDGVTVPLPCMPYCESLEPEMSKAYKLFLTIVDK